jgi:hypothetical protein
MVFDLDTFAFKRGWGAYGHTLAQISTADADRAYTPGGPMPKEFRGHLTLNFSKDGKVYAADRAANRIHVTDKQGKFEREIVVAPTSGGGSTGGVAFSPDPQQRYLFISDLNNNTIWFLNRADGALVGRLGSMKTARSSPHDRRGLDGEHYTGEVLMARCRSLCRSITA